MNSGIYKILNAVNGKFYIGSAVDLANRESSHFSRLAKNTHKNKKLQNSYNLHGEEAFTFQILERCSKEELISKEQIWLDFTQACERGYNNNPVAGSQLGNKWTIEQRANQSRIQTGKKMAPDAIAKTVAFNTGAKRSAQAKINMSIAQKGKVFSEATRLKMSLSRKGKIRSEVSKQKLRDTIADKKLLSQLDYFNA